MHHCGNSKPLDSLIIEVVGFFGQIGAATFFDVIQDLLEVCFWVILFGRLPLKERLSQFIGETFAPPLHKSLFLQRIRAAAAKKPFLCTKSPLASANTQTMDELGVLPKS